jgi:glyoxylase-like metal-dependent hydrolase (beta-lactamase superfamily II)
MTKVIVLVEGYARGAEDGEYASSSVTLIREGELNILVDPGADRVRLLAALESEKLSPSNIDFVILTHIHVDHCLLAGIFENAKVLDDSVVYSFDGGEREHGGTVPGTDIRIVPTPGHDQFHAAVLVTDETLGKIAVAADLFWWPDGVVQRTDRESLLALKDPYVKDPKALRASREKILDAADYIIPGHGKPFRISG